MNEAQRGDDMTMQDKPLAVNGLTSYRYRAQYGYIMIGATDEADALREAQRSCSEVVRESRLEVWNGLHYAQTGKEAS